MPILEKLFDSIGDSNILTIMDLKQSFNQIVLIAKDCKKTTFHVNNKLREWLVMPFLLKNGLVFFQWLIDQGHTPKLFNRLQCESKLKTMKKQRDGAHSLARSTLGGRGVC